MIAGEGRMARPWRIEYDGAYYHVLSRGNEGGEIFYDDKDRRVFVADQGFESVQGHAVVWRYLYSKITGFILDTQGRIPYSQSPKKEVLITPSPSSRSTPFPSASIFHSPSAVRHPLFAACHQTYACGPPAALLCSLIPGRCPLTGVP